MEKDLSEMLSVVEQLVDKKKQIIRVMQKSIKSQKIKNLIEHDILKMSFNPEDERVTFYSGKKCFNVWFDSFVSYLEACSSVQEDENSFIMVKKDSFGKDKTTKDDRCLIS